MHTPRSAGPSQWQNRIARLDGPVLDLNAVLLRPWAPLRHTPGRRRVRAAGIVADIARGVADTDGGAEAEHAQRRYAKLWVSLPR